MHNYIPKNTWGADMYDEFINGCADTRPAERRSPSSRGDAAAAAWIFCGDGSRRRRGNELESPR